VNDSAPFTAYLAADEFRDELVAELVEVSEIYGNLVLAPGPARPAAWAQNIWCEPRILKIASIGDAARQLRAIQRNWALYPHAFHRRASLIQDKLPPVSGKPLRFGDPVPQAPLGAWTLLDAATMLASPRCSSQFANGQVNFVEDRLAPPSRAYLKLWEALTLIGERPGPGDLCLDLGASPGGWTWVLQGLGARVISIDKAPLDPAIAALPGVEVRRQSAFALDPKELGPVDWLVSDVICYPERLYRLIEAWLAAGTCRRFICTLKFQGETDHATARRFAAIPNSRLMHLSHNKHELTWVNLGDAERSVG
jgi:23S rRNA (cytidine2498-2'-O)-methyltransferase